MTEMTNATITDKVKEVVIEHLGVDATKVTLEADLVSDLGADSLDTVELVMALEETFRITIEDEEAANIKNVKAIIDCIEKKL
jgi:acyl carrier protein